MSEPLALLGAVLAGAPLGLVADRLSTRWPAHEDDYVRRWPDWRTAVVVIAGAAVAGGLVSRWQQPLELAVLAAFCGALIVLLATDLDQRLLPDLVTLPLIGYSAVVLALNLSPLLADKPLGLVSGVGAAIGAPLLLFVTDRLMGGQLGGGDLKLAVSLGLTCGALLLFAGLIVASIGFSIVLLALIAARRLTLKSAVPFGPVLIVGAFVAVMTG